MTWPNKNNNTYQNEKETDLYKKKEDWKKMLGPEGSVISFLTKAGQVIILNVIWLLSCIPIITIGTATTSLYYAMMKNIRRNRSYPVVEYFASFNRVLGKGSIFTIIIGCWYLLLFHLQSIAIMMGNSTGIFLSRLYLMLMLVTAAVLIYLFPVLSRFTMSMTGMVKLAFVMAVRYAGYTVIMTAGTAALVYLWIYVLPMPAIFFLPGAWCYVCTFMNEKALRHYMPAPDGNEDAWYYE